MEMPHIGTHCAEPNCRKLDFLPFMCNLCKKNFCIDHHKYDAHTCPESHRVDVQVPICPLCGKPVPSRPGQPPDLAVNEHLENNCTNKKNKIYTNRCSASGCKTREMVPVRCDSCRLNYCLRHRHPQDHQCQRASTTTRQRALAAAQARSATSGTKKPQNHSSSQSGGSRGSSSGGIQRFFSPSPGTPTPTGHTPAPQQPRSVNLSSIQGGMSEDEALARAMAASMEGGGQNRSGRSGEGQGNEEEDAQLAQALAASMRSSRRSSSNNNGISVCVLC